MATPITPHAILGPEFPSIRDYVEFPNPRSLAFSEIENPLPMTEKFPERTTSLKVNEKIETPKSSANTFPRCPIGLAGLKGFDTLNPSGLKGAPRESHPALRFPL